MTTDLRTRLMRLAKADPRVRMGVSKILKLSNDPDMGIYTRTLQYVAREMANLVSGEVVSVEATYGGGVAAVSIRNYMGQTGSKVLVILEDNTDVGGDVVLRFEHDDVFGKNIRLTEGDASAPSIQELLSSDAALNGVHLAYASLAPGILLGNKIDAAKVFLEETVMRLPKRMDSALKGARINLDTRAWNSSATPTLNKAGNVTFDVEFIVEGNNDISDMKAQLLDIFSRNLEHFKVAKVRFHMSKKVEELSPTHLMFKVVGIL